MAGNTLGLNIRETASAISPFITKLILEKKSRERKRALKIEELKKKEKEQADKIRQEFAIKNFDKLPQQDQTQTLSEFGFKPEQLTPEQQAQQELDNRMKSLGLTKQPLANLIESGSAKFPGLTQSPLNKQKVLSEQQQTKLIQKRQQKEQSVIDFNRQRAKTSQKLENIRTQQTTGKGSASQQRQALENLQRSLLKESSLLDTAPENTISKDEVAQRQLEIAKQLRDVREQLTNIGKVRKGVTIRDVNDLLGARKKLGKKRFIQNRNSLAIKLQEMIKNAPKNKKAQIRKEAIRLTRILFERQ